jgi:hypothetical protein
MNIMMMARELQATDSRDKIYAMLGLVRHAAARLDIEIPLPEPDYTKTLDNVSMDFVSKYVREMGDLNILTSIEDTSFRQSESLPSWIPDLSVPLLPHPFSDVSCDQWNAGGTHYPSLIQSDGSLSIRSRRLATINDTALPFDIIQDREDWRSFLRLILNLKEKTPRALISPDEQILRVLTCSTAIPLDEGIKSQFSDWVTYNVTSSREDSVNAQAVNVQFVQSFQYIDDSAEHQTPDVALRALNEWFEFKARRDRTHSWHNLGTASVTAHDTRERRSVTENESRELLLALWQDYPHGIFPSPTDIQRIYTSLRSVGSNDQTYKDRVEHNTRKFCASARLNMQSRLLFSTEDGYLGLGTQSTEIGDEIWIISRCKVPVVLRQVDQQNLYRVVGQCFIPHAMLGQFAFHTKDLDSFQQIKIV